MTKSTAMQVFSALSALPVSIVDALNTRIYFSESVSESAIHAIVDPLEWTDVSIQVIGSGDDPYTQYLNTTRHDSLLRHSLGTVVLAVPQNGQIINESPSSTFNAPPHEGQVKFTISFAMLSLH